MFVGKEKRKKKKRSVVVIKNHPFYILPMDDHPLPLFFLHLWMDDRHFGYKNPKKMAKKEKSGRVLLQVGGGGVPGN
jgi:hypothetical protein